MTQVVTWPPYPTPLLFCVGHFQVFYKIDSFLENVQDSKKEKRIFEGMLSLHIIAG